MMAPAMSYTPRGTSDLHARRRREAIRRFVGKVTFRSALDATIVALTIALAAAFAVLGWLIGLEPR